VRFKGCVAKKFSKDFLNRSWGLNKLFKSCKKLARRQDKAAALMAYKISLVLLFCNIHITYKLDIVRNK